MNKKVISLLVIGLILLPGFAYGINIVAEGFRVSTANKTVDAWGICRVAIAQTSGKDYFVPTKTLTEWQSVINNKPSDLSLAACTPQNGQCNYGNSPTSCGDPGNCSVGTEIACGNIGNQDGVNITCSGVNGGASSGNCRIFWCLTADTLITIENGTKKPISALAKGDRVVGQTRVNTITVARNFTTYEYVYGINGSKAFVTGGHPFMTKKGWRAINPDKTPESVKNQINPGKLVIGDYILLETGKYTKVETITPSDNPTGTVVYNPGVDGDNTYYANGMLVHNK